MQPLGRLRLAQLLERTGFELSDPFSGETKGLADLFEGVLFFTTESISQPKDQLFAWRQAADQRAHTHSHAVVVDPAIRRRPRTARLLLSVYQVGFLTLIEASFWSLKAIFGIAGPFVLQHRLQQIRPA
jgi:hypothetical protein